MREKVFNAKCIGFIKEVLNRSVMDKSTQICIKHCQNGRMINKTHVDYVDCMHDVQIVCDFYLWWVGLLVYSEFSMA